MHIMYLFVDAERRRETATVTGKGETADSRSKDGCQRDSESDER